METLKTKLIDGKEAFYLLKNGRVWKSFDGSLELPSFKAGNYKIVHILDESIDLSYHFEKDADVSLQEVLIIEGQVNVNKTVVLEDNASVHHLCFMNSKRPGKVSITMQTKLLKRAILCLSQLFIGQTPFNFHQETKLAGELASVHHKNVIINSSGYEQDFHLSVSHEQAKTLSSLQNYGIANHQSLLKIFTNGIIAKKAIASDLKQKAKGLILDEKSQISANPWLEINEHDCLASHGASIGAIDDQELYYLMSRGLTKEQSEKLIINGFIWPLISEVPAGKLRSYILQEIDQHL
ncbi:MAG TPA: SufD family Fe-S cluster assembly protein [Bacilli bacterium]|nr:MAG: FeS cluster assembly protein SufD [Tenericutes bacterium ADurb.BinA124]HNZ50099.1 SufD family Fe-S cluster assembly protein [Bacilli bacterium]HPX84013.1 SufD family Fe-S cluster assembly protein [Bacilli bacterium]HQC74113.1 SufD family Fe-S cluster assembly protein [Bacilli bacterium]